MEIRLGNIPEYLKKSQLYRNFKQKSNDDDIILMDRKHNRQDINIASFDDLCIYLDMYRYWNIDDFFKKILYTYVKNNNENIRINYLKEHFHELDIIEEFQYILDFNKESCNFAAENDCLDLLKILHENNCPWDEETCSFAAKNGNLNCLIYAYENGCQWNIDTTLSAAENGHLECLKYACDNGCPYT